LKALLLTLAALAILGLTSCSGGNDEATSTGPLTLEQRVVTEEDAPGSKPDPVEKQQIAANEQEFTDKMGDVFVNPSKEDEAGLKTVGFVEAINDTRYFGETHSRDDAHTFSLVVQLDSPDGAKQMTDFFHTDSLRPCPESCAFSVTEFDVDGIPGATGVRRFASEEDIQAAGTSEERPYDSYAIFFADGDFAYNIDLGGPPGTTSEDKAVDIAQSLYDRVHGRPAG
jgi:hypothetical protein